MSGLYDPTCCDCMRSYRKSETPNNVFLCASCWDTRKAKMGDRVRYKRTDELGVMKKPTVHADWVFVLYDGDSTAKATQYTELEVVA